MIKYLLGTFLPLWKWRHASQINDLNMIFIPSEKPGDPLIMKAVIEGSGEAIRFAMNEYPDNSVIIFKRGRDILLHRSTSYWVEIEKKKKTETEQPKPPGYGEGVPSIND